MFNRSRVNAFISGLERAESKLARSMLRAIPSTRAIAVCPFHENVTIRVGDDPAESHAYVRASKIVKSDGTTLGHEVLNEEISRQLSDAADGVCPECAALQNF
jgi:hypothetical protein